MSLEYKLTNLINMIGDPSEMKRKIKEHDENILTHNNKIENSKFIF